MNQKALTKTITVMILNLKRPLVSMVYTKIFQRFKGSNITCINTDLVASTRELPGIGNIILIV